MNEKRKLTKKKPDLQDTRKPINREITFLSDSSDSSFGSFFERKRAKLDAERKSFAKKKTPPLFISTPTLAVVGRTSATMAEHYDHSREDTTETSRMMDLTRGRRTWSKVIDLTNDTTTNLLPGPRLQDMVDKNHVYWTYDPRGVHSSDVDTAHYCSECKCPYHYCAKLTYGDLVTDQVEYLLKEMNDPSKITYELIQTKFRGIYWNCVHHKMMMNSIPFPDGYKFPTNGVLPSCISLCNLNKLFRRYGQICDENRDKDD